jgi:hypothetical protein
MAGLHFVRISRFPILDNNLQLLAIHGDKQQNERDWVLNEFKTGKSPIMVATDVASRGIGMIANTPSSLSLPSLSHFPSFLLYSSRLVHYCVIFVVLCSCSCAQFVPTTSSRAIIFISVFLLLLGSLGACRTFNALLTVRSQLRHQGSLSRGGLIGSWHFRNLLDITS